MASRAATTQRHQRFAVKMLAPSSFLLLVVRPGVLAPRYPTKRITCASPAVSVVVLLAETQWESPSSMVLGKKGEESSIQIGPEVLKRAAPQQGSSGRISFLPMQVPMSGLHVTETLHGSKRNLATGAKLKGIANQCVQLL